MPQNPSYRRDLESQQGLLKEELYRLYGPVDAEIDRQDLHWVNEALTRLETGGVRDSFSAQDREELRKVRYILQRVNTKAEFLSTYANYNPDQPRDDHGRWGSGGTGGKQARVGEGGKRADKGKSMLDVPKAVAKLEKVGDASQRLCATKVREAIEAGGIVFDTNDRPTSGYARDYGKTLEKYGFEPVANSTSTSRDYPPKGYQPEAGDVVVIQNTSTSREGHMAMFSGKQWISDFKQRSFWPGGTYRDQKPLYVIYRHTNK